MRAPLVVVYDVRRDVARGQVAETLRCLGALWIQQSAWVLAPVPRLDSDTVVRRVTSPVRPGDRVWVYEPCPACERGAQWLPGRLSGTSPFRVGPVTLVLPPIDSANG